MAVAAVPLPVGVEARQVPSQFVGGDGFTACVQHHDLKRRVFVFSNGCALVRGFDADAGLLHVNGQRDRAFNHAATLLAQFEQQLSFEWPGGFWNSGQQHRNIGKAFGVGDQVGVQRFADRVDDFVRLPELVAFIPRDALVRGFHDDLAFKAKTGSRWAVKITAVGFDDALFFGNKCWRRSFQLHVETFRYEVLNQERALGDGAVFRIGVEVNAPSAGHRGLGERQHERAATQALIIHQMAGMLDAIRARDDECCWQGFSFAKG